MHNSSKSTRVIELETCNEEPLLLMDCSPPIMLLLSMTSSVNGLSTASVDRWVSESMNDSVIVFKEKEIERGQR